MCWSTKRSLLIQIYNKRGTRNLKCRILITTPVVISDIHYPRHVYYYMAFRLCKKPLFCTNQLHEKHTLLGLFATILASPPASLGSTWPTPPFRPPWCKSVAPWSWRPTTRLCARSARLSGACVCPPVVKPRYFWPWEKSVSVPIHRVCYSWWVSKFLRIAFEKSYRWTTEGLLAHDLG